MRLCEKVGIGLILLQVADGTLTYWGVNAAGLSAEGNPIVKFVMEHFGIESGLLLVKSMASLAVCFLTQINAVNILILLTGLYTSVVIMWLYLLYF
jgi:hypothetical protein